MDDKVFCLIIIALIKVIELLVKGLLSRNGKKKSALLEKEETTVALANPGNPYEKPGDAQECKKHMKALAKIETEVTNIKNDIRDNIKHDIRSIFNRLNAMRRE